MPATLRLYGPTVKKLAHEHGISHMLADSGISCGSGASGLQLTPGATWMADFASPFKDF